MSPITPKSQSLEIITLRDLLDIKSLPEVIMIISQLDKPMLAALNLNVGKNGRLLTHSLIDQYVRDEFKHNRFNKSKQSLLIEFLTAMEVNDFNVYDLKCGAGVHSSNLLNCLLNALYTHGPLNDGFVGSELLQHVANRVSSLNDSKWSITPLMQSAIRGRLAIIKILLDCGADPNYINEKGYTWQRYIDQHLSDNEAFYQELKAYLLTRDHQVAPKNKRPTL